MPAAKPAYPRLRKGHPLAQGLAGAWLAYEGSGTKVYDLAGKENHATLQGSASFAAGQDGWALSVASATNSYAKGSVAGGAATSAPFTLAAWCLTTTNTVTQWAISLRDGGATNNVAIGQRSGSAFKVEGFGSNSTPNLSGTTTPSNGAWYHVAYTWDATTGRLYVNGNQEGSNTSAPQSFTPGLVFLGRLDDSFDNWTGLLSGGLYFTRRLSADEVAALYADSFRMFRPRSWSLKAAAAAATAQVWPYLDNGLAGGMCGMGMGGL